MNRVTYKAPWRRILERRVLDSVRSGASLADVARREHLDVDTVRDWCANAKVTPRTPDTDTPLSRAVALVGEGCSYKAAARAESVSVSVLYRACRKRDVTSPHTAPPTYTRSVRDSCVRALRAGLSQTAVSREFGVGQSTLSDWCRVEGITTARRKAA